MEIALNSIMEGIDDKTISRTTGLTIEEIKRLKKY